MSGHPPDEPPVMDALTIRHCQLPFWARHSVGLALLFVLLAAVWACTFEVDEVVQASGKLVSDQQNIVMKPLERAVVKEVNVAVGEIVKRDQILITFDPTGNRLELERLKSELETLTAQQERLTAEQDGKPYQVAVVNAATEIQKIIFDQRASYYREKMKYFDQGVAQLDASRTTLEDGLANQQDRLASIVKIENLYKDLLARQATSAKDMLSISMSRMEMESEVNNAKSKLSELAHQRETVKANCDSFVAEWRHGITDNLVKIRRELVNTQKQYDKYHQMANYVFLRSPCDAVVHEITPYSSGSAVREAEALMTLVPLDGKIEAEAEINPEDISKIKAGSQARIKINSFPYQKHGTLDGVVRIISGDTFQKQSSERTAADPKSHYYRARLSVGGKLKNLPPHFRLIPGMEIQVEVKTGQRRIITFLWYPIMKSLDEALREP